MKVGDLGTARSVVTDHAVLRFLERVYGVDVELIRHEIAAATAEGREAGEITGSPSFAIVIQRVRFVVDGGRIVSVLEPGRRQRFRSRR